MVHARMKRKNGMPRPWQQAIRVLALMAGLVWAGLVAQPIQAQDLNWVQQAGGALPNIGNAIAADGSGNTCVAGFFLGSVTFGPDPANPTGLTLTSAGVADIFVAKYAVGGTLPWVQQIGGAAADNVYGIALDGNGN